MPDCYSLFRRDRSNDCSSQRGGGVLIAVRSSLISQLVLCDNVDLEFVAVTINLGKSNLYIACSYIPPCSVLDVYNKHANLYTEISSKMTSADSCLFAGDFNLPNL